MNVRYDGSRYPNHKAESAVLEDEADAGSVVHEQPIGDLLVTVLGGGYLYEDQGHAPQEWESFESGIIKNAARELRALHCAIVTRGDENLTEDFDEDDANKMLFAIVKRLEAAAELAHRLRVARWGNPHFGGGETMAAEALAKLKLGEAPDHPEGSAES
jgi:hypothetical protein